MSSVATAVPCSQAMITQANWHDLNAVRKIEVICFPKDAWPLWDIIGVLALPNVIRLKAVCNGQTVGFIAGDLRPAEKLAWIATIGVLPDYRRRGIGTTLLQACEEGTHLPRVRLNVRVSNDEAIRLYKGLGYVQVGMWPRYYQDGEDALILEKKIFGD
jgi:ribosomal protein S18 acetylase RimI-like enzyme